MLLENAIDISERIRKTDVQHHRLADGLWTGFEIAKWVVFCHSKMLLRHPARSNLVLSDIAIFFSTQVNQVVTVL